MHISPSWLTDGRELLMVTNRDVPLGSGNVVRVPVAPSGIEEAQTVLREQTLYRAQPDVSIDGKRFIYASTGGTADQFTNLYVQLSSKQCSITSNLSMGSLWHFGSHQLCLARRRVRGHVVAGAPRKPDIAHLVAQSRIARLFRRTI